MKKLVTFIIISSISFGSVTAQSQTCDCKSDLDFLVEKMKDMPSFKKQIKGDKLVEFENTYNTLSANMTSQTSISDCFGMLNMQMMVVNDIHAQVLANDTYLTEEEYSDEKIQEAFLTSDVFLNHPKTDLDLIELEESLKNKQKNSLEGIYNYGKQQIIGIYKYDDSTLMGIVLSSEVKVWQPGQIKFVAKKNVFGKYNMFTYHNRSRKLIMARNLTFENGRIWSYKKTDNKNNFENDIKNRSNWDFKQINDDVQYVYFGNFSSFSNDNKKAYKDFYEKHKKTFNAKHIIVDLRSNAGGNKKLSDPFIKLFKKSKAKIYILTNSFTGSNGEQFTTKLKKIKGSVHLGQTTYGIITYGLNYGKSYTTPSGHFNILPTDMSFQEFFEYEGKGVTPDIKLDFDKDWIEQTLEIIEQ